MLPNAIHEYAKQYHEQQRIMHPAHYTKRLMSIDLPGNRAVGFLFNLTSVWIGVHYSKREKRFCMNLIPCCTIWWTRTDGEWP